MMANTIDDCIKLEPMDDWSGKQGQQTNSEKHVFVINLGEPLIEVKKEETQDDETAGRHDLLTTELAQRFVGNVEELTIADVFSNSKRALDQKEGDFPIQVKLENSPDARLNDPELSEIGGLDYQSPEHVLDSSPKNDKTCKKENHLNEHEIAQGHTKAGNGSRMYDSSKPNADEKTYKCKYCDKNYKDESHLRKHERGHTAPIASVKGGKHDPIPKLFQCHRCEKKYKQISSLREHLRIHTLSLEALNARPYKCQLCENTYKRKSHLRAHEKRHAASISEKVHAAPIGVVYQCQPTEHEKMLAVPIGVVFHCQLTKHEKVHSAPILSAIEEKRDPNQKLFQGIRCEKKYKQKSSLKEHQRVHTLPVEALNARPYKCRLCENTYKWKSHLRAHEKRHAASISGLNAKVFQCQPGEKNEHGRGHTAPIPSVIEEKRDPNQKLFQCNCCEKKYKQKSSLKEHERMHTLSFEALNARPYKCQLCEKTFKRKGHLTEHTKKHFPKLFAKTSPKKHICHKCGKSLSSFISLENHLKAHLGLKEHMCQYCGKCFAGRVYLVKHEISYCPVKAKKHKCTMCKKDSSFQSHLHHHMFRVHSTGKKSEANLKASVSSSDQAGVLKIEQRKNHPTGQQSCKKKPHRCRVCEKSFQFLNLLKKHQFLHAALLNYKCDTCGRRYKTKAELARHCFRGHKVVIYSRAGVN